MPLPIDLLSDGAAGPRRFKIEAVESEQSRGLVNSLLKIRYGWRGHTQVSLLTDRSVNKFTLSAVHQVAVIGTITVTLRAAQCRLAAWRCSYCPPRLSPRPSESNCAAARSRSA